MAPSHILQIFLRVTVQNQTRIAQRIVVDEVVQFRPLRHGHIQCILDPQCSQWKCKTKKTVDSLLPGRHSYRLGTAGGIWRSGPYGLRLLIFLQPLGRALKNQNAAPTTPPCFSRWLRSSSLLFKSSYPQLLLKGNCHVKQKRQLSKAVFLVVQECNPNPNHFPRMQLLSLLQR